MDDEGSSESLSDMVSLKLSPRLNAAIEQQLDSPLTKSEFIREAIRERLDREQADRIESE